MVNLKIRFALHNLNFALVGKLPLDRVKLELWSLTFPYLLSPSLDPPFVKPKMTRKP